MGEWLSGMVVDVGRYLRDAILNLAMAVYSGVVTVWEIAAHYGGLQVRASDYLGALVLGALAVGSFAAYRRAKRKAAWDRSALRIEEPCEADLRPDQGDYRHMLRFWIYAKKPMPQPNRIRLWFTAKPQQWSIKACTRTGPKTKENEIRIGKDGKGRVKTRGRRLEIEYLAPALDGNNQRLFVFVWSDAPITLDATAAFREWSEG